MRIVYMTANLPYGTNEAFIVPEVRELKRQGHDVLVIPRSPKGPLVHGGELLECSRGEGLFSPRVLASAVRTASCRLNATGTSLKLLRSSRSLFVRAKNLAVFPKAVWLARTAANWNADHIHCHWGGTTATIAMAASCLSGIPWSLTLHRWDIVENNLLATKAKTASMVRFISHDGMAMAESLGVLDQAHARVLHMGVEIPQKPRFQTAGVPIVLCPARLVSVKGHRFLLEAWRLITNDYAEAELWLAGDGPLRSELEQYVKEHGLQSAVRFLGVVPHSKLLELYAGANVAAVVLASIDEGAGNHEGIPVALIEAMSYGVPVIATAAGGVPELLVNGTGLLTKPRDISAMADAICSILGSPTLAARLGTAARHHISQNYDIQKIVSELVAAFVDARVTRGAIAAYPAI